MVVEAPPGGPSIFSSTEVIFLKAPLKPKSAPFAAREYRSLIGWAVAGGGTLESTLVRIGWRRSGDTSGNVCAPAFHSAASGGSQPPGSPCGWLGGVHGPACRLGGWWAVGGGGDGRSSGCGMGVQEYLRSKILVPGSAPDSLRVSFSLPASEGA